MPVDAPNEDEVLANQVVLHSARQLSAVKALAAQFADSDDEESDGSDGNSAQEQQLNLRASDIAGIGYQAPASDDVSSRQESAATERLRRQLLGKNSKAPPGALNANGGMVYASQKFAASTPKPNSVRKRDSSVDEDEGRSSMGKKRDRGAAEVVSTPAPAADVENAGDNSAGRPTASATAPSKKRGGSYLDQILAERAAKKKRKKTKRLANKADPKPTFIHSDTFLSCHYRQRTCLHGGERRPSSPFLGSKSSNTQNVESERGR